MLNFYNTDTNFPVVLVLQFTNQILYYVSRDLRGNKLEVITTLGYTPVFEDLPKLKAL